MPAILGDLDIAIDVQEWVEILPTCQEIIENAVLAALKASGADTDGRPCELSVVLSDNDHVQELNRDYREKDKPTNVLSFPALDCEGPGQLILDPGPVHLGDIVLALGVVRDEAIDQNITFEHHLVHLIVHGVLHLVGYDHIENDEAEEMEALEISILSDFGIANPYENEAELQ